MSSDAEAKIAGVFTNAKNPEVLRQILIKMGYSQPPTPIQTDNTTARDIITNTVKQRKTLAMDMRFYWLLDRAIKNKYHFCWRTGKINKGDYYTKHHTAIHHQQECPSILNAHNMNSDLIWQGCIGMIIYTRDTYIGTSVLYPKSAEFLAVG